MKKYISALLIISIIISAVNPAFAHDYEAVSEDFSLAFVPWIDGNELDDEIPLPELIIGEYEPSESCITHKESLTNTDYLQGSPLTVNSMEAAQSDYVFDGNLFTKFNTVTAPSVANGANEPKFSYNSFIEENVSDYSGELTLNFEDLVLDGANGLDLRIGRTYQSVATGIGDRTLMVLPNSDGILCNVEVNKYSSYLNDRYNLGSGWGFSFPSVEIATEYIPEGIGDTYYYLENVELYYHSGNGDVYQVEFTSDTTDSNLKGYYKKDICFNKEDEAWTDGDLKSYYSLTLADKTKQYFAKDGRLMAIVDRFGNAIRFEYAMTKVSNRVPEGSFRHDDGMWEVSCGENGLVDATPVDDFGRSDTRSMYFARAAADENYIKSNYIQVEPNRSYDFEFSVYTPSKGDIEIEILQYDTAHTYKRSEYRTVSAESYNENEWFDYKTDFSVSTAVRYVEIKISPQNAKGTYIDNVYLNYSQPLISKITDTIGRTVDFEYTGDIFAADGAAGQVKLIVTSPYDSSTRELVYNKELISFVINCLGHDEQRQIWYLNSSNTEGADGSPVKYFYEGSMYETDDGEYDFKVLYSSYDSKTHSSGDFGFQKPVLDAVQYKDRVKRYEYEAVRKHLGDDGYYDTLRVCKKYDMCGYVPDDSTEIYFDGEVAPVVYTYVGTYDSGTFDNETGYPDYFFDDESEKNELWTVTKTGKSTGTVTFSNCALIQQTSADDGVLLTKDYTNHEEFKNSPVQVKNTYSQGGNSRETYLLYSYNDWGGISGETNEISIEIKNDSELLPKYTTEYEYESTYHLVTNKAYYISESSEPAEESYTYDQNGLITSYTDQLGNKASYYYENTKFPWAVTRMVQDDPMGFNNVLGDDRIITYIYDIYGLYVTAKSEHYNGGISSETYSYDYITGDLLQKQFSDGSYMDYQYNSDGKINRVIYPYSVHASGNVFYTYERHFYTANSGLVGYDTLNPIYTTEIIAKYEVIQDDEITPELYSLEFKYYDAVGNLKLHQRAISLEPDENNAYTVEDTAYYHDNYDRLVKAVDCDGNTCTYSYDGFDRTECITDSEGNRYLYSYDTVQNIIRLEFDGYTEADNRRIITQKYDDRGNMTYRMVYPENTSSDTLSESYEYDIAGNPVSYTDPNGNVTGYEYDAKSRLRQTILPNGQRVTSNYSDFDKPSFEKIYNADGTEVFSRVSYRNEKGDLNMKFYHYDKELGQSDSYVTDEKGRITELNEGENTQTFRYDEIDRVYAQMSGDRRIGRQYDAYGEVFNYMASGSAVERFDLYYYNVLGAPAIKNHNNQFYTQYDFSANNRLLATYMPSGREESYTYTPNGNLSTLSTDGKNFSYEYYDTGFIKSITYPNGLKTSYEYDNINRVRSIVTALGDTVINTFAYTYDGNGNTLAETRNGETTAYTYDSLDRLTSVTYSDGSKVSYEYDGFNNRTREIYSNGDVKEYVYNGQYQLTEVKLNGTTTDTYAYNKSGAIVSHNDKSYTYDSFDRLTGYTDGTNTHTYTYD
ncbi:MAG: RHS repeat protein, partial [Clostridia bacterium]|nr:RHS repeat protein [Clostridia bacterium]